MKQNIPGIIGAAPAAKVRLMPLATYSAMEVGLPASGLFSGIGTLTPVALTALESGNTYFNIHTGTNPGGEIRGQRVVP